MDYSAKRLRKLTERDERIAAIHYRFPDLAEIDEALRRHTLESLAKVGAAGFDLKETVAHREALEAERRRILQKHGMDLSIYTPDWDCKLCEDRGFIAPGVSCTCRRYEQLLEAERRSGLPADYRSMTLERFDASFYKDPEDVRNKLARLRRFVMLIRAGQPMANLILIGDVGTGKTHLAVALANELLESGKSVAYHRVDALLDDLRRELFEGAGGGSETMRRALSADLLILDDLGRESVTEFALTQLAHLIEGRNAANRPWIVTSNLSVNEIGTLYGLRLQDRLMEKVTVFRLETEQSIRLTQAHKDVNYI